jgi:outer membrane immunogenic protein
MGAVMKKLLLAAAALAALSSRFAMAADMARPVYKAPPPPPPPVYFSWTGFYIGLNAGYGWTNSDIGLSGSQGAVPFFGDTLFAAMLANGSGSARDQAFTGGIQLGYNVQFSSIVVGLEGDFNSLRTDATRQITAEDPNPNFLVPFTFTDSVSTNWIATIRPRIGLTTGPALFYVTGGLALTNFKYDHNFTATSGTITALESASVSKTKAGWTVGGGVEWAFAGNWSVKGEYLYADFGSVSSSSVPIQLPPLPPPVITSTTTLGHSADLIVQTVRIGINYRFGDWGKYPVVARY